MVMAEPLAKSRWSRARWLVMAPHPDDETLGAGALIAHAIKDNRLGSIVFLTDGTGSHPAETPRVGVVRRREAGHAIRRLCAGIVPQIWMGWQDGNPHGSDSRAFERDVNQLAALIRRQRISAVAVSDITDAHCDHMAAYRLAEAALGKARRPVALFAYHVWGQAPCHARRIATPAMCVGRRRHALLAHRSQISPTIGEGFRLPRAMRRMEARDVLTLRKEWR